MAVTKEEILDTIAAMSVLEVSELVKAMEEKFGVTAAVAVAAGPAVAAGGAVSRDRLRQIQPFQIGEGFVIEPVDGSALLHKHGKLLILLQGDCRGQIIHDGPVTKAGNVKLPPFLGDAVFITAFGFQLKYRSYDRNSPDLKALFSMPHCAFAVIAAVASTIASSIFLKKCAMSL